MRKISVVPALALVLLSACAGPEEITGAQALSPRAAFTAGCGHAVTTTPCTTPAPANATPVPTTATLGTYTLEWGTEGSEGDGRAGGSMGSGY